MNKDIRLSTTFYKNLKTLKLQRRLGSDGVVALQKIWIYAGTERPNGRLEPLDRDEFELIAEWTGERGLLIETLIKTGFVEKTDRGFAIHDWEEHNAYAFHAPDRNQQARKAASARWGRDAQSMLTASSEHTGGNAPSPSPSPSPSPDPIPKEEVVPGAAFIMIPLADNTEYPIYPSMVAEWQRLYPNVEVEQALRDIRGWNLANKRRRKTVGGIMKHINAWLADKQNRGSNGSRGTEEKEHWE